MAKLQHTFVQGKMNKDLDERLVPNGQYRDAQNIQVSTSEGSDVGAVENILGNTKKNLRSTGPDVFWQDNFGLQNPVCIGVVKDSQNEKIYWFLNSADSSTDAIVEYDQTTGIVAPILVDVNGVLNFNKLNLITGINIIDGLLYWTDDLNEPKVINIERFKAGSTDFTTQTVVYGAARNFVESDVVVIKKAPQSVLTALASPSLVGGAGTGITPILTDSDNNLANVSAGDSVNLSWQVANTPITWPLQSSVILNAQIEEPTGAITKYQVTGTFTAVPISGSLVGTIIVSSATPDIPDVDLRWSMLLVETEPIFKDDFPRFSYRYKFTDGRYSPYATFSNASFVPGKFEYLSRDGNNEGMKSIIRKIEISNFSTTPFDVEEIEVLYKGSRSNNVYLIESFNYDFAANPQPTISLTLTSGTLGRVIESSQLLRLFDAVPKKAKAQESIGNRIVYGNYLQNYNISNSSVDVVTTQINAVHSSQYFGLPTVKTDREYQIGITFLDDYGRESPVFTSAKGAISLDIANSSKVNSIQAKLNSFTAPTGIEKFKYYIKEPSAEYYNIALDRYYDSSDGGAWLSFPSSEVNKVREGQYIVLKKGHDTDAPITINNKYKILDISNEAPEFLTSQKIIKARGVGSTLTTQVDFEVGNSVVRFQGPTKAANPDFYDSFVSKFNTNIYIRFQQEVGSATTAEYRVISGTNVAAIGATPIFEVQLAEPLKKQDAWIASLPGVANFLALVFEETHVNTPEFQGRFFAKINPNATFYDNVSAAFAGTAALVEDRSLFISPDGGTQDIPIAPDTFFAFWTDSDSGTSVFQPPLGSGAKPELPWQIVPGNPGLPPFTYSDKSTFVLGFADTAWASAVNQNANFKYQTFQQFIPGAQFKFKYSDGSVSQGIYKLISRNGIGSGGATANITEDAYKYFMDRDFDDTQFGGSPTSAQLTGIVLYRPQELEDQELLSSSNPAIFETEPQEQADLELFYEATGPIDISNVNTVQTLNWFNAYSFGNGVESDRIRDDFNATLLGNGVRVSTTLEEPYVEERRGSGLIFSGILNSISGVNNSNQFLIAENITKDLNPSYGTLQKLHARDTDLIALLEDKCFKILANKDALFNADGNTNVTSNANVLGQTIPFVGEYGISKNPESFASFGFRAYFTDKARGAVMRLSRDGLTDISDKGMSYFFQDRLKTNVNPSIIGAYDSDAGSYNVVVGGEGVSFKEKSDGWNTRLSYDPEAGISLNNEYYTFKNAELYEHSNTNRSNFYGVQGDTTVTPIFNDAPTSVKNFKTLSYEGDEGWTATVTTNKQSGTVSTWKEREGIYFNYISGDGTFFLAELDGAITNSSTIVISAPNTNISVGDTVTGAGILNVVTVTNIAADKITITISSAQTLADGTELTFTKVADVDTREFSVMGIGNVLRHDVPYNVIIVNGEINVSLQPGDIILTNDSNNVLQVVGTVLSVNRATSTITLTASSAVILPTAPPAFILFTKNTEANTSGLLGYYGEAVLSTSSSNKKELFAVNSEIFISSE